MSDEATSEPTPPPTARVRLLETLEPGASDKTRYDAGTEWTFSEDRALALVEAGQAELLPDALAANPAPQPEPAEFVGEDED